MSNSKASATFVNVQGNLSEEAKQQVNGFYTAATEGAAFARHVAMRLEAVEANVYEKADEPGKQEVKLVFEIDVAQGQLENASPVDSSQLIAAGQICATSATPCTEDARPTL